MEERICYNCIHSYDWDFDGCGLCLLNRYKVVVKSDHVCKYHRYDEDDNEE